MDLDGITALSLFSRFSGHRLADHGSNFTNSQREKFIEKLPSLTENDLTALDEKDSSCPICFTPFLAILASEEMASAMESPALSVEDLGVTRLAETCGHVFCRKDITTWIRQHDTCPTCRRPFITRSTNASNDEATGNGEGSPRTFDFDLSILPEELVDEEMLTHLLEFAVPIPRETSDGQTRRTREAQTNEENVNEFVGMYS
ncbi:hypothetical protein ACEPAH_5582 [Sanghuangporus vaninii]